MSGLPSFNSGLVRLIGGNPNGFEGLTGFQFRFGAIDRLLSGDYGSEVVVFQFRFGAIDRVEMSIYLRKVVWFQFRFGAIDRIH